MANSKSVLLVGLGVLLVGGIAMFWVLPSSGAPSAPVAPVTAARPSETGARGFDGMAAVSAPGSAQPMQLAPDVVAPPATPAPVAQAAGKPPKPVAPVAISGRVLDETGRPVNAATVTFVDDVAGLLFPRGEDRRKLDQAPHAETGVDGRFTLTASVPLERSAQPDFLPDMRGRLTVRHDAFATLVHSCGDVAPGTLDVGDLQLEPGAWIVGRVVDTAGRPLADAEVSARNTDGNGRGGGRRGGRGPGGMFGGLGLSLDAFTTGGDGRFSVHGLRAGAADLMARKNGMRLADVPDIELESRVPKDIGDVVLETGTSISGVALDADGAALAGAEVSVSSMTRLVVNRLEDLPRSQIGEEFGQRAVAGSDGRFEVSGLGGGTYNVHLRADGYAALDKEDVPAGTTNLRLQPVRLGALLLTVVDSLSGNAVEGARIKATPSTSGDGPFFMPAEPLPVLAGAEALAAAGTSAGPLPAAAAAYLVRNAGVDGTDLVIAAAGYATQELTAPAVASHEVVPFTVRLVPDSLVGGHVLDEKQQPVDGATVTLRKRSPDDDSPFDPRGRFERRLVIRADGDAEPELTADTMSARTGVDGRFELRGAAAGDWTLSATAPDRVPSEPQPVTLDEGRSQDDLVIVLAAAGSVAGLVTEADGTPSADVAVIVEPRASATAAAEETQQAQIERQIARMFGNSDGSRDGPRRVRTDTAGRYQVTNLAAGEYGVKIDAGPRRARNFGAALVIPADGGGQSDDQSLTWTKVVPGAESRVDLVRAKRGVVTGSVVAGGKPAAGVSVSLRPEGPLPFGGERTDTDAAGTFRFEDVEAGSYTVSAQAPGAALPERSPLKLEAGQEGHVNLVFSGSTVSGHVLDDTTNAGAAGLLVRVEPVQDAPAAGAPSAAPQVAIQMNAVRAGGGPNGGMSITLGGGRSEAARTDDKGNFTLNYLKPGRYTVEASGSGYMRASSNPIEVRDNENKSDVSLTVSRGGVVEGLVVSGSTGDRLDQVPVRLEGDEDQQMTVTREGSYRFDGLQPGDYTVNVLGSGFDSDPIASEKIKIEKNGEVHKLDLTTKG